MWTSHSPEQTIALGRYLGHLAPAGMCIALEGDLGAGKTHLVQGVAQGALVADPDLVSSPTFVLMNIYLAGPAPAAKTVYHLDAYRTHGSGDFEAVGLDECLTDQGLVVIEWPQRVWDLLPADHLKIEIVTTEPTQRVFTFTGTGPKAAALAERLRQAAGKIA